MIAIGAVAVRYCANAKCREPFEVTEYDAAYCSWECLEEDGEDE